jgi:ABC-type lipoprotein release transport system permease subunit
VIPGLSTAKLIGIGLGALAIIALLAMVNGWRVERNHLRGAVRDRIVEVSKPVAVHPISAAQIPAVPAPLGPRPSSLSAAADLLLSKHCEFVIYVLKADPLLRLSAGLPQKELPSFPECQKP